MASREMADLMGEHADHLVGRLCLNDGSGIDEDLASGNEGVERRGIEQHHLGAVSAHARCLQERRRIVEQEFLDLRIAHDRAPALGRRA